MKDPQNRKEKPAHTPQTIQNIPAAQPPKVALALFQRRPYCKINDFRVNSRFERFCSDYRWIVPPDHSRPNPSSNAFRIKIGMNHVS